MRGLWPTTVGSQLTDDLIPFNRLRSNHQGLSGQLLLEVMDYLPDIRVNFHAIFNEPAGVEHGAVVAAAKGFTNGTERFFGHLTGEEHRNLARESDVLRPTLARHICQANVEMFGNFLLDYFDVDGIATLLVEDFAQQAFNNFNRQFLAGERRI